MFFYPQKQLIRTPKDVGINYEDVNFKSRDGMALHGWYLPAEEKAWGTVLFFHGNAENISTHLGAVYWMPAHGLNVFLFDYRGYGKSQGKTEIQGMHLDATAALNYLKSRPDITSDNIIIFGQSLGAAIAMYTAATQEKQGISSVVVESTFSDYRNIFREKLSSMIITWPLQWPLSFAVENAYSPLSIVHDIQPTPILFIHGDNDITVPHHHSEQLYKAATQPKQLWLIPDGQHTQAFGRFAATYRPRLIEYLKSVGNPNP